MFFVTAIVTFGLLTIVSRVFGKEGIFAWVGIAVVLANIFVCKCVDLFSLSATLGNVLFGTIFLSTDILTERYGVKTARKAVWVGVSVEVCAIALTQLALVFNPNSLDTVHDSMSVIFGLFPRTTLASISMFVFSNQLDIWIFDKLKQKTNGKYLFLRNNVATIISQCIENYLFYVIAFLGIFSMKDILQMTLICCIVEIIVSLVDTPFLYLALYKKENKE
jgi:uncharacterized integral membrane protein (TIGR00697 family)